MRNNIVQLPSPKPQKKREKYHARSDGYKCTSITYTDETGQKRKKVVFGKTDAEVDAKRDAVKFQIKQGVLIARQRELVSAYADEWLRVYKKKVAANTYKTYEHDVALINDAFGMKRLVDVTKTDVLRLLNTRDGLSKSAIKKTRMTVRAIFKAARQDKIIATSPCEDLPPADGPEGSHKALPEDLVDRIQATWRQHDFGPAAMFMLFAGLRRGEAVSYDTSNVDLNRKIIRVTVALSFNNNRPVLGSPKSDAGIRELPLFDPLVKVVISRQNQLLVTGKRSGTYMSERAFRCAWNSYKIFIGVPDLQTHDLRHTFCSMGYDAGVDVKTMQKWLGHSDPMVTMRIYTHLSEQKETGSRDHLSRYFSRYSDELDLENVEK
jgi:integrase